MSTARWQRLALIGVCASAAVFVAGCLWLVVGFLAPVLGLFFGGWLIACLQEPLVAWLVCRTRASRSAAVAISILTSIIALGLASVLIAPSLGNQVASSVVNLPGQLDAAAEQLVTEQGVANAWLAGHGVPVTFDVASSGSALESMAQEALGSGSAGPARVISGGLGAVGSLGTMLLLSVFFLLGGPQLAEQVIHAFGGRTASDARFVLTSVHDAFEGFARAQLVQAALYATAVWACLNVAHVETAPLAAILAGLMLIVPLVGAALAIAVPLLAALLWNPDATLPVAVALILLEQLVLNVVAPRLMSRQLGLPPLMMLFGILAGAQIAGFWGAIFGIPVLAALLTCIDHFRPRLAT